MIDEGYAHIKLQLPALLTVVKEINTPRFPTLGGFRRAQQAEILTWQADDLEIGAGAHWFGRLCDPGDFHFVPEQHKTSRLLEGTAGIAQQILASLGRKGWEQHHG